MLAILALTFPFFALVLCGYVAVRSGMLAQSSIPGLNSFVLYFALPCMLYRFGAATPLARLLAPGVFAIYLLAALLMVALAVALALAGRKDWNDAAFGALVAAFPNTGFMGIPMLLALLGPDSSGPVIATLVVDLVITSSLCVGLSRLGQGPRGGAPAVRATLAGMARNPMPWAIVLGALASGFGLVLPKPAMQAVGLLADAASPVALFTIGAVLARSQLHSAKGAAGGDSVPIALMKLLLHPMLVFGIGRTWMAAGLALDPFALKVLVLVACLPSAGNVAMLAERFGADTGRIARIIVASTALSFLTFSAAVALLS